MKISVVHTAAFLIIFLSAAFHGACAETTGHTGTGSAEADSILSGTETTNPQKPLPLAEQKEPEPGPEAKPEGEIVTPELSRAQSDPCETVKSDGATWLDHVHALVEEKTCEPAVWFDNFFGEDHVLLDLRPGTFIVFRNSARLTDGLKLTYAADFSLSLDLPRWERTLRHARLYIESRSEIDKYSAQQGQPVQPGINQETGVRQPIIGVRIDPYIKSLALLVSIDSGVKINMHPNAFIRMRYQYSRTFAEVYLARFSEIAMWRAVEHFSNTMQFDLERNINSFTLVRWGNSINYIEDTAGIKWNTGISYFIQMTPRSALSFDTSMWGVNDPGWAIENYRVGSLYRLNFYRPWLFFEIAPEVTWPKDESGRRHSANALMSTIEIQFGK